MVSRVNNFGLIPQDVSSWEAAKPMPRNDVIVLSFRRQQEAPSLQVVVIDFLLRARLKLVYNIKLV